MRCLILITTLRMIHHLICLMKNKMIQQSCKPEEKGSCELEWFCLVGSTCQILFLLEIKECIQHQCMQSIELDHLYNVGVRRICHNNIQGIIGVYEHLGIIQENWQYTENKRKYHIAQNFRWIIISLNDDTLYQHKNFAHSASCSPGSSGWSS